MKLRRAIPEDVDLVVTIDGEADGYSRQRWAIEVDSQRVWVPQDEIVGVAAVQSLGDEYELHRLVVASSKRGCGYGRAMLDALLARFPARWILEVGSHNDAARALYQALGFEAVGVRREYYPSGEDAIVMAREP